jgi:hypothetical protein
MPHKRQDTSGHFRAADHIAIADDELIFVDRADVAQLVEHRHGKAGVKGSSPFVGLAPKPHGQAALLQA